MKVSVVGTGYVGLVTGACLAEAGNDVVCMDVDADKIAALERGEVPIYEPGLEPLVAENVAAGRLRFTTDMDTCVDHGLFQFIAVGTPPDEDGSADLRYVLDVARGIGARMDDYRVIIDKSTVPVGTADKVRSAVGEELAARGQDLEYDVVSNPEFLKEGAAVEDFMKPDRVILGCDNVRTGALLRELYAPFNRNHERVITMDVRSAEMTKYAANAMLATKISFMNEVANLCERVGADVEMVRQGIGSDPRIGFSFIYPGAGFGGSCFPKDVAALERTARDHGYTARMLQAVEAVNAEQKTVLERKIVARYGEDLTGKTFALWGLAFKPNTDDMREAPARRLMEGLWARGATVRAHDPEAMDECRRIYGERADLTLVDDRYTALEGADALVLVTEWKPFRSPDFDHIAATLRDPVIFDGRNIYDPAVLAPHGLAHVAIGRPQTTAGEG
ncbi:UDP-glucose 6-dehydrogenase [Thiohalorhabdus denitrificans]|uniref:UDP-glucose 6-dehydrogenase n=1 Tax=Thiohalorhabdus denitrificans TaxID=381306 RepID=A0A0N8PNJ2_9GAMM|nr:UDP-glucose/GDP-mannose dehydrogenase family protein [Thiohalorhabdus denitrificans]KPV41677.1 UDP-glucose 6-dehydrogenase [Thiohalorhabdus denitrificans]SCY55854.1 UDPglucose 6-dehydrogenase [Thiohalorhabdus denitrificans]